jgi:hypothetical protein
MIKYVEGKLTLKDEQPVYPGGEMRVTLHSSYQGKPMPGIVTLLPKWPADPKGGVSPGAAEVTGSVQKFWEVGPTGDVVCVMPIPADVTSTGAPPYVMVTFSFLGMVDNPEPKADLVITDSLEYKSMYTGTVG